VHGNMPSLLDIESRLTPKEIYAVISEGRGLMPPFAHLSDEETDALVSYLINPGDPGKQRVAGATPARPEMSPRSRIPYTFSGYNRFFDPEGYPAVKPPWGTLNAIDLNTGEYVWKITLGEFEKLSQRGIPPTGTENYGGPVVTSGGILFIGATQDEKFRAFDKNTGELLWETRLPAGGYATPATYEIDGRQFVVIAAGGGKMGTKSGDTYVAFALP
jgi:quinoprotein glucose dehydrogenase